MCELVLESLLLSLEELSLDDSEEEVSDELSELLSEILAANFALAPLLCLVTLLLA